MSSPARWIPLSAAAAGLLVALALHFRRNEPAENPVPAPAALALILQAETVGNRARLEWDPGPHALEGVSGATLSVADGTASKAIRLTVADLHKGYFEWDPASREVTFDMRLEGPGVASADSSLTWRNPLYVINSSSDTPLRKPAARHPASLQAGEHAAPTPARAAADSDTTVPMAAKSQQPGRVKRIVNRITSKASHLWPFRSAKPAPQIP